MSVAVREKIVRLAAANRRSTDLLARFSGGYALGWHMAVKACFRAQLDIRCTVRNLRNSTTVQSEAGKLLWSWTQGPRIAFDRGHVFYDTPEGYQPWSQALKAIGLACIVKEAKPNEVRKEPSKAGDSPGPLVDGFVVFDLFKTDPERVELLFERECRCSQNEFVEFLISGDYRRFGSTSSSPLFSDRV